jgi:hypothetical protein
MPRQQTCGHSLFQEQTMRPTSKWILFGALFLAMLACGPLSLASPSATARPATSTPVETSTATPPPATATATTTATVAASSPTPSNIHPATLAPSTVPAVIYDGNVNAYRIRFPLNGSWVEINDSIPANGSKRYALAAIQGQIMSVSIPEGFAYTVNVTGANNKWLSDPNALNSFWRGVLPASQDYIVTVGSQMGGPFHLRIAINPLGHATQIFEFINRQYGVILRYTDEFAPATMPVPITLKGTPLLTLAFINTTFFSPSTNLSEAYLELAVSIDPAVVTSCTQASAQFAETITGQVMVNGYTFTRSEFSGAAAGNRYDQVTYRTVTEGRCFELAYLIHSTNIGNYPPGTVVEFDRPALLGKFDTVLNTFLAK